MGEPCNRKMLYWNFLTLSIWADKIVTNSDGEKGPI